jgi:hypothetical protein
MDAGRLDQVHIDVAGELVEISWDERNELIERIRIVVDDETIVRKFEAVGTRLPVELDSGERGRLRMALELWDAVALGELPLGIAGLLAALAKADPGGP